MPYKEFLEFTSLFAFLASLSLSRSRMSYGACDSLSLLMPLFLISFNRFSTHINLCPMLTLFWPPPFGFCLVCVCVQKKEGEVI
jgi:hypothetical protein